MLRFRTHRACPPGGYRYEVPETKVLIETPGGRDDLLLAIRKHYGENGLTPPPNLWERVQDFICRRVVNGFCIGSDDGLPRARVITLQQARENTRKCAFRSKTVDPGTAAARGRICTGCARNNRAMCTSCTGLNAWAAKLVGNRRVPGVDDWVGLCSVDAVAIAAKIWVAGLELGEHPKDCWLWKELSKND
jgi:hypothetical protein